jgi:hypothetical protein
VPGAWESSRSTEATCSSVSMSGAESPTAVRIRARRASSTARTGLSTVPPCLDPPANDTPILVTRDPSEIQEVRKVRGTSQASTRRRRRDAHLYKLARGRPRHGELASPSRIVGTSSRRRGRRVSLPAAPLSRQPVPCAHPNPIRIFTSDSRRSAKYRCSYAKGSPDQGQMLLWGRRSKLPPSRHSGDR